MKDIKCPCCGELVACLACVEVEAGALPQGEAFSPYWTTPSNEGALIADRERSFSHRHETDVLTCPPECAGEPEYLADVPEHLQPGHAPEFETINCGEPDAPRCEVCGHELIENRCGYCEGRRDAALLRDFALSAPAGPVHVAKQERLFG